MFQNIVMSPIVLDSFSELPDKKINSFLERLLDDVLLSDSGNTLLNEYQIKVDELIKIKELSPLKNAFLPTLTVSGKFKFLDIGKYNCRKEKGQKEYSIEKALAIGDQWKLIITQNEEELKKNVFKEVYSIELSDINNYLNPSLSSRIRSIEAIEKRPEDNFDFRQWISKYLVDAKELFLQDGYCCKKFEREDLKFILSKVNKDIPIKIITLSDSARNRFIDKKDLKPWNDFESEKILSELGETLRLKNFSFILRDENEKKLIDDRYLETDIFKINLGHALGSVIPHNGVVKRQFAINVSLKSQVK